MRDHDQSHDQNGSTEEIPIFESSGTCTNSYLAVSYGTLTTTGVDFDFRAFSFGDNTVDDTVVIVSKMKCTFRCI